MGINEPFRCIVAGHRLLIISFVIVPLAIVFAIGTRSSRDYVASARIQATSDTLGSDTEADSVLNRIRGIATSSDIVARALHDAGISGLSPVTVAAHDITVSRLGSSAVVDIDVTNPNPKTAQALASAVADEVVNFVRGSSSASSDRLLARLNKQESVLLGQRRQIVLTLGQAKTAAQTANLSAQLSSIDQQLSDLSGTVQQLEVAIATDSSAAVIATDSPATRVTSSLAVRLILVGIGGLVAGLLIASLLEVIRPRLADARAVARELDAPMIGPLGVHRQPKARRWSPARLVPKRWRRSRATGKSRIPTTSLDARSTLALRRAAANAHVGTLALVGTTKDDADGLAKGLTRALDATATSSNGRGRPESAPRPTGGGGSARQATRTANAIKQVIAAQPTASIRVVTVDQIGAGMPGERYGLIVIGRALMPSSEVRRIKDLVSATGWPVIGVLDLETSRGTEKS